jgi:hypothetical protein
MQNHSPPQSSYRLLQQQKRTFPLNIFQQKLLEARRNSSQNVEARKSKHLPNFLIDILDEPIPFKRRTNSLVKDYISAHSTNTSRAHLNKHSIRHSQPESFYQYPSNIPKLRYKEYSSQHLSSRSKSKRKIYDDYFEGGERNGQKQSRIYRANVVQLSPKTKLRVFSSKPISLDKSKESLVSVNPIDLKKSKSSSQKNAGLNTRKGKFKPALNFMDKVLKMNEVSRCSLNLENLNSSIM